METLAPLILSFLTAIAPKVIDLAQEFVGHKSGSDRAAAANQLAVTALTEAGHVLPQDAATAQAVSAVIEAAYQRMVADGMLNPTVTTNGPVPAPNAAA